MSLSFDFTPLVPIGIDFVKLFLPLLGISAFALAIGSRRNKKK